MRIVGKTKDDVLKIINHIKIFLMNEETMTAVTPCITTSSKNCEKK